MTMQMNRRTFLSGSAATVLGAGTAAWPGFPAAAQQNGQQNGQIASLYEAAKKEGEITWYVAQIDSDTAERVGKLFSATYPGIKCNVVRATGQVIYQRLSQDTKAKVANCDVFGTTDLGHLVTLRKANQVLAYKAVNLAASDPVFRDYDPEHYISVTGANCTSLTFNTKLVNAAEAPKKWTDLLDPKWAGQLAVAHPGYSGAMGTWVVEMQKLYGWEFFEMLAKNKPLVGRSLVEPPTAIASGERKVGMGPSNLILNLKGRGNAIDIAYPTDGVILQIAPTCILTSAPHPQAARLFMEFLLSKEVGALLAEDSGIPFRDDVPAKAGVAPIASLKLIRPNAEELVKAVPSAIEKWRDIFGV
jgi:iron(III) transport system substrate-binding protein